MLHSYLDHFCAQNVEELIAAGLEKLGNVPSGGALVAGDTAAPAGAPAAAEAAPAAATDDKVPVL
jgi:hypothetical protein